MVVSVLPYLALLVRWDAKHSMSLMSTRTDSALLHWLLVRRPNDFSAKSRVTDPRLPRSLNGLLLSERSSPQVHLVLKVLLRQQRTHLSTSWWSPVRGMWPSSRRYELSNWAR